MTKEQYLKELEEIERKADEQGCCIILAKPLIDPDEAGATGHQDDRT